MVRFLRFGLVLILPVLLFGGETGKIVGKVTDPSTGEPLVGVDVYIENTDLGAVTGSDGGYVINFVPAGTYEVTASYIGYEPVKKIGVVVLADQTTYLDFKLKPTVYKVEKPIISIAERPIVVISSGATERHITAKEFDQMPIQTVGEVIALQSGVVMESSGGFTYAHIRGGREDEVVHFVDGISVRDPLRGYQALTLNKGAIEEVSVITGGFDPEYGEALSGVINIVTKEGGPRHSGFIRYTTDDIFPKDNALNFGHNFYEVSLGGPLGFQNLRYIVSGELRFDDDCAPHHYRVPRPQNEYKIHSRLTYRLPKKGKLSLSGFYTRRQFHEYSHTWKFHLDGYLGRRWRELFGQGALNLMLGKATVLSIKGGYLKHTYMTGPRDFDKEATAGNNNGKLDFWEDYQFIAEESVLNAMKEAEKAPNDSVKIEMWKDAIIDTLLKYWIQPDYSVVPNPYGVMTAFPYASLGGYAYRRFYTSGYYRLFRYEFSRKYEARVDLNHAIGRIHDIKTGFQFKQYRLGTYYNSLPWSTTPFWDVYDYKPIEAAYYIQDKLDFQGLILRGGIRVDYFDPKAKKRLHPEDLLDTTMVDAEKKYQISPRLAFSFPITERSKFRFNYGHFFQTPPMRMLYMSLLPEVAMRGNQIVGNPDLHAKKTIIYEVGYENAVTDVFGLNFTAFYKDIYDMEGTREVFALPVSYTLLTNVEYGNVKGFEVAVIKRLSNYWRSRISYTLQYAKGTASNAFEGYYDIINAPPDPITGEHPPFPKIDYPLDFDRRHTFHFDFGLFFPHEFAFLPLRDLNFSFIFTYNSGTPYTPIDQKGNQLGDKNSAYMPGYSNVDLKISKAFKFGRPTLTFFCQIYNLFNTEQWLDVWPSSGRPDDDEREVTPGQFRGMLTTFDRLYHPSADGNHDGYITGYEYWEAYMRARADIMNSPNDYGPPRIIRFGAEFSF